jgi:hypothetical protein
MANNWWDYIPGVSNVAGIAKGDAEQAFLGPGAAAKNYFFDDPANEAKAAYDQAMGQSQHSAQQIQDFLMGQQKQALGYYQPVQNMFNTAYGSQGLKPPGGGR